VEDIPWEDDIEALKQRGVALMSTNWDSPIEAADELRSALGLPQDWSSMSIEQWKSVIDYAESMDTD